MPYLVVMLTCKLRPFPDHAPSDENKSKPTSSVCSRTSAEEQSAWLTADLQ